MFADTNMFQLFDLLKSRLKYNIIDITMSHLKMYKFSKLGFIDISAELSFQSVTDRLSLAALKLRHNSDVLY